MPIARCETSIPPVHMPQTYVLDRTAIRSGKILHYLQRNLNYPQKWERALCNDIFIVCLMAQHGSRKRYKPYSNEIVVNNDLEGSDHVLIQNTILELYQTAWEKFMTISSEVSRVSTTFRSCYLANKNLSADPFRQPSRKFFKEMDESWTVLS